MTNLDVINLIVLQVDKKINELCDIVEDSGDEELFEITSFKHINYFEFAKLPNYEPIPRVRVVPNQIWVEDKENLPFYITETLSEENISYIAYEKNSLPIDDFATENPIPIDIKPMKIKFKFEGR